MNSQLAEKAQDINFCSRLTGLANAKSKSRLKDYEKGLLTSIIYIIII